MNVSCAGLASEQGNLFPSAPELPEGFAYRENLISEAEEQALLKRFGALRLEPYEFRGYFAKRRVVSFGWHYQWSGRKLQAADPIPEFLLPLRARAAQFAGVEAEGLQQMLVNEYDSSAGIGWHRDRPMYDDIVVISLGAACVLRLRREHGGGWKRTSQCLRGRSGYLLRGPARRDWEHSIPSVPGLRYSVTFRNFVAGFSPS